MQFLKTLFWCLLAFVAALFTYGNWFSVPVRLWSNIIADVNLPFLLLLVFLAGFVPALLWGQTVGWRLRQRLTQAERVAYAPTPSIPASTPAPVVEDAPA
ncbi:hypothetical protein [uncultured Sphingomonas sp.]|uniref:hypothetical protein n=1 Tax=uncultured Sphingomonas sp. TaxID=158754 RepID=UPI0035C9FB1C